jgi:uncharacterized membrane protein
MLFLKYFKFLYRGHHVFFDQSTIQKRMRTKYIANQKIYTLVVILILIILGTYIRFFNLTLKTIWTDEVASIVYSLGSSFKDVPLNQIINLETLLKPLEINENHGLKDVIKYGIFEDFVPPLHFMLLHVWIFILEKSHELVSIFTARSLSVYLSVISIPGIYWLASSLFKQKRAVCLLAALIMTLSPYSIALAQETRHYSIAIVCVILSMLAFFNISETIIRLNYIPVPNICLLVGLNIIGVASHYFFVVVLISEVLALIAVAAQHKLQLILTNISILSAINLWTGLIWLPVYFLNNSRDDLTAWAEMDVTKIDAIANLLLQPIIASITMISLLPVESSNFITVIVSALIMLATIFLLLLLIHKNIFSDLAHNLPLRFLTAYLMSSILMLVCICCVFAKDFLSAPRYHFIYFPALITLISYFICNSFENNKPFVKIKNLFVRKKTIFCLFIFVLATSSFCVVNNLSFLKSFDADVMAEIINDKSSNNTLIVTNHKTLNDTSNLMALGWQFINTNSQQNIPKFFLDEATNPEATQQIIYDTLKASVGSTSLWLINYDKNFDLDYCSLKKSDDDMPGYNYKYYYCS